MRFAIGLLLLTNLLASGISFAADSAHSLSALRKTFLQAEQYIKTDRDDDYFALSDTLKNYPLYPYLHYQWLSKHLDEELAITTFLHDYPHSRYTALLHNKWLSHLGHKQQWLNFIRQYQKSDDVELQCYFSQAQYLAGQGQAAMAAAKQFWLSGKTLPTACDRLFDWLRDWPDYDAELIWQRFENALRQNNAPLAKQTLALLPAAEQIMAETWLKLHERPQLVKEPAAWKRNYAKAGALFAHAIARWTDNDPLAAVRTWDEQKQRFDIAPALQAEIERRLAMGLALRRDARAYARLTQFAGSDPSAQEWRVRSALIRQNWADVLAALDDLGEALKTQDKWRYWRARALAATVFKQEAQVLLEELAKQRSFYGFMAADRLQQKIELNHQAVNVTENDLEQLRRNNEFLVVNELFAIDRRPEATRQWWHAMNGLSPHQLTVAAKLAEHAQWPALSIATIAKANQWDDMDLRFPLSFSTQIMEQANAQALDPSLLFALIRQESAFDEFAGSSAGAIGLMQLMPATARQIAGELKEPWNNDFNLVMPAVNLKYGSHYFKKILNRFDGHPALAIAAYNAGSQRVKQWLPKNQTLPADIWIETIPYKETRTYVTSVIAYALIYQQRLQRTGLKVTDFLKEVGPG